MHETIPSITPCVDQLIKTLLESSTHEFILIVDKDLRVLLKLDGFSLPCHSCEFFIDP